MYLVQLIQEKIFKGPILIYLYSPIFNVERHSIFLTFLKHLTILLLNVTKSSRVVSIKPRVITQST